MYKSLLQIKSKYIELEEQTMSPEIISDIKKYTKITKEINSIKDIVTVFNKYLLSENTLKQTKEILKIEKDEELLSLAKLEIQENRSFNGIIIKWIKNIDFT